MDGEHIEMMIHGWASSELREKAIVELANMREELYILRQLASGLTKRVPDVVQCAACKSTNVFEAVICVDCCAHTAPRR